VAASALEFWFEFGSTYSYLSAVRIEDAEGVQVSWRPFLLGPIFEEQGWNDSPFNVYPAKGRYMWRDMERLCTKYGIPFARPSRFPRDGLLAARVACLASVKLEP
jgi:2-hydroxychromene-2-carboxylate isomerase